MAMHYSFLVEPSPTAAYQQIIDCLASELEARGHKAVAHPRERYKDAEQYIREINRLEPDFILITNPCGILSQRSKDQERQNFELTHASLVFVHHDNLLWNAPTIEAGISALRGYARTSERSRHFCIEYHNYLDLKELGIDHSYPVLHCTEVGKRKDAFSPEEQKLGLSFVGHVADIAPNNIVAHLPFSHNILSDYYNKLSNFSYTTESSALKFASQFTSRLNSVPRFEEIAAKYFYQACVHSCSQAFRADTIKRIGESRLDIFGGDPAYLHGSDAKRNIRKASVRYHSPTKTFAETTSIYASSRVSLNITALQFDRAINNRVLNIGGCGGFPLTDWKEDLSKLSSVAKEISYQSPEELQHKLEYYLHDDNQAERLEIAKTLHDEVHANYTYGHLVDRILLALSGSHAMPIPPSKIDIGCGPNKAPGFVGVDKVPHKAVDVVADLNQRFPFTSHSVDIVRAHDAIEHLTSPLNTMKEIWRICKHGARVDIRVPSTDGRGAFQDPTHVSFWNRNSFYYYSIEHPEYLDLCHSYGFTGGFRIEHLSEEASGDGIIHVNAILRAIKPDQYIVDKFCLKTRNILIRIAEGKPNEETVSWQEKLCDLLFLISSSRNGSDYCLILDIDSLDQEDVANQVSAVMLETMFSVPSPPSGMYPGISCLPAIDDPEREIVISTATTNLKLDEALDRFTKQASR